MSSFGAPHAVAQAFAAGSVTAPASSAQPITTRPVLTQSITVQVLDGRTGKPLSAESIRVDCAAGGVDCPGISSFKALPETHPGELTLHIPATATALWIDAADDEHTFCAGPTLEDNSFSIRAIRTSGQLGDNQCGHIPPAVLRRWQPRPGRLVVFVTRKSWWHKLLPYC